MRFSLLAAAAIAAPFGQRGQRAGRSRSDRWPAVWGRAGDDFGARCGDRFQPRLRGEKNGRVFYPAVTQGVMGRLIGQILGDATDRPAAGVTIHFLFRGDEPLELTVYTPQPTPLVVQPRATIPGGCERELTQWWRQYNAYWRQQQAEDNQPPLVSTY